MINSNMQLMYKPIFGLINYVASDKFSNLCKICNEDSDYYFVDIDGRLYSNNCISNDNFKLVDTELKIIDVGTHGFVLTSDHDVCLYNNNTLINTTISNIQSLFFDYIAKTIDGKYMDLYNLRKCEPVIRFNEPIIKHITIYARVWISLFMMSDLSIGRLVYDNGDPGNVNIIPYDGTVDDYDIIVNIFNNYPDGSTFIKDKKTNQIHLCCDPYKKYYVIDNSVYYNGTEIPSLYQCNTCIAKKTHTKNANY